MPLPLCFLLCRLQSLTRTDLPFSPILAPLASLADSGARVLSALNSRHAPFKLPPFIEAVRTPHSGCCCCCVAGAACQTLWWSADVWSLNAFVCFFVARLLHVAVAQAFHQATAVHRKVCMSLVFLRGWVAGGWPPCVVSPQAVPQPAIREASSSPDRVSPHRPRRFRNPIVQYQCVRCRVPAATPRTARTHSQGKA